MHALADQSASRDEVRVDICVEQGNVRVRKSIRWGGGADAGVSGPNVVEY